ncbi:GNAT family N-acetyltransferase [Kribbella sp. NBC_01245]|uniref:GNAT family N-acetyltransferase n=1 Tax=Kribbella sp. NBC_01245 TaxID=2903578 RepID=UPI002E284479|nr:GNAT family N-acetyltransferase [Kribbella sp. NBC_01245]
MSGDVSVRVTRVPAEFEKIVFGFLQQDPVLNTVLLGNVHDRAARPMLGENEPPVLVSVHDPAGQVIGAAMRTAGRGIHLGGLDASLAPEVAATYAAICPDAPQVSGTADAARAFAGTWSTLTGKAYAEGRGTRLHRLDVLAEPPAPSGSARRAVEGELDLCARWAGAFEDEVALSVGADEVRLGWARTQVQRGLLWLWEDAGEVVSMASLREPIFGASRIGPVYTPDERRGRGYASALTAVVSRVIVDAGSLACLYTDLANPTSNKIYAALGYRPVADFVDYVFT